MSKKLTYQALLLLCCLLPACASLPLTSMWKLRNFDPLNIEPNGLQLVFVTSDKIDLSQSQVVLSLGFEPLQGGDKWHQDFTLSLKDNEPLPKYILNDIQNWQQVYSIALPSAQLQGFRQAQSRLLQIQRREIKGKGMFGLGVDNLCIEGDIAAEQMTADVYIRLQQGEEFFPLFRNFSLITDELDLMQIQCLQDRGR